MGFGIGIPELVIIFILFGIPVVGLTSVVLFLSSRAKRLNYPSTGAYLGGAAVGR